MGGVWFGLGKRVDLTFLGTNKKPRKMLNKIRNGRKQNLQHLDRFGKQHKHLFSGMQHLQKSSFVSLSTRLVVSFCFPPLMMEFISMSAMINFDTSLKYIFCEGSTSPSISSITSTASSSSSSSSSTAVVGNKAGWAAVRRSEQELV